MRKSLPKAPPDRTNGLRTGKNSLKKTRRRLRPEQAENEIIEAAERFLRTHPFRALQVADLMDQTQLGRPSFYHYFRDRHDLIVRLVKRLGDEISKMNQVWFLSGADPVARQNSKQKSPPTLPPARPRHKPTRISRINFDQERPFRRCRHPRRQRELSTAGYPGVERRMFCRPSSANKRE